MVIVPFVSFRKGIPPGSTSNRLEAWSPPFQLRPFPSTDPIALTPTALPPRPTRAADEIGAESWKELKALSTYESTKYICLWKKSSLFCNRFSRRADPRSWVFLLKRTLNLPILLAGGSVFQDSIFPLPVPGNRSYSRRLTMSPTSLY